MSEVRFWQVMCLAMLGMMGALALYCGRLTVELAHADRRVVLALEHRYPAFAGVPSLALLEQGEKSDPVIK